MARLSSNPKGQLQVEDGYLIALAKGGNADAYDRLVRRYYGFVRLKASSYFLAGGDSDDLIQEGLVGLYKAIRDYRTDRESSFRNFAELCITRQIITAVKTATRNKHTPLNQYVSFSSTPAGTGERQRADARRDDRGLTGSRSGQSGDQLRGAARARQLHLHLALRARVAGTVAVPGWPLLRGGRPAPGLRLQDGRQRASAGQAEGGAAPRVTRHRGLAVGRLQPRRSRRPGNSPGCMTRVAEI